LKRINPSREAAERRADKIRAAMVKGQANRFSLSHGQWQDICVAREILRSVGVGQSLTSAIREWAECRAMLDNRASLLEATKFFLSNCTNGGPPHRPTSFTEAADAYHKFKVAAGKSKAHCKNIKSRLDRPAKVLPADVRLDELTAGQLDAAVVELGVKEKTRNEYQMMLGNF
jgi:hypothetical protein